MPVQQISVVPARDTSSNGRSAPRPRDKNEVGKTPGRSGIRPSTISKASNSTTGLGPASRTPVSPSPQDICSQLKRPEEEASVHHRQSRQPRPSASPARSQKKQVRRRHRRRKDAGPAPVCVAGGRQRRPSSEGSRLGEARERPPPPPRPRRELPPRLRRAQVESTSDEEGWREGRSWSREKARRGHQRGRQRDGGAPGKGADAELRSLASGQEGNGPLPENGGGWKDRGRGPVASGGRGSQEGEAKRESRDREMAYAGCRSRSHGRSGPAGGEGAGLITKSYQDKGSAGGANVPAPSPRNQGGVNEGRAQPCSEDSELEVCRICHCQGDEEGPLITPCRCTGSLRSVHQACLHQWIRSSDTRCCELCKFDFIMETQLKPLCKWEKLNMSKIEKRKVFCSVLFHLIAVALVLWSVHVLFQRTIEEIQQGKNDKMWRISLLKHYKQEGVLEWPFWTKLIMVAIGFTGSLIFMYIQCKVYLHLWRRLKAFNRIITVQNCPEKAPLRCHAPPAAIASSGQRTANRTQDGVAVPVTVTTAEVDSDRSVEDAVAPEQNPV